MFASHALPWESRYSLRQKKGWAIDAAEAEEAWLRQKMAALATEVHEASSTASEIGRRGSVKARVLESRGKLAALLQPRSVPEVAR